MCHSHTSGRQHGMNSILGRRLAHGIVETKITVRRIDLHPEGVRILAEYRLLTLAQMIRIGRQILRRDGQ